MKIREALELAIASLQSQEQTAQTDAAIQKIQALMKRELITHWSKESIIKALDRWQEEHSRPPRTTNLSEPGMPGGNIIYKHFDMKPSSFLRERYPDINSKCTVHKNVYGLESDQGWIDCFRTQFLKHHKEDGFRCATYNSFRDEGTPMWQTIAKHFKVSKWNDLMKLADVQYDNKIENCKTPQVTACVSPFLERFEAAVKKREELDRELIAVLNKHK